MKTRNRFLYWAPRILCIIAIIFLSLFALDAFGSEKNFWQELGVFFMALIPTFVLVGLLILSWRKELIGGILFIAIGFFFSPWIYQHNFGMNHSFWTSLGAVLMVTFPVIVVGILFILSHLNQKKYSAKHD